MDANVTMRLIAEKGFKRYACFDRFGGDSQAYGYATGRYRGTRRSAPNRMPSSTGTGPRSGSTFAPDFAAQELRKRIHPQSEEIVHATGP